MTINSHRHGTYRRAFPAYLNGKGATLWYYSETQVTAKFYDSSLPSNFRSGVILEASDFDIEDTCNCAIGRY